MQSSRFLHGHSGSSLRRKNSFFLSDLTDVFRQPSVSDLFPISPSLSSSYIRLRLRRRRRCCC